MTLNQYYKRITCSYPFSKHDTKTGENDQKGTTTESGQDDQKICFVSPAVITIKKDKSVKSSTGRSTQAKITRNRWWNMEIWRSKNWHTLCIRTGKMVQKNHRNIFVFSIIGGGFMEHYQFKKGIIWPTGHPHRVSTTIWQSTAIQNTNLARTIFSCVTKGNCRRSWTRITGIFKENYKMLGYWASEKKTHLFKNEQTWL